MAIAARRAIALGDQDELAAAEDRVDVLRAVASLPRPQREALVLVEWLGYGEKAGDPRGCYSNSWQQIIAQFHGLVTELGSRHLTSD